MLFGCNFLLNKAITFGPLLHQFSKVKGVDSIEPDYTMLKAIIKHLGFEFIAENEKVECSYSQNSTSMLQYTYNCEKFAAMKM